MRIASAAAMILLSACVGESLKTAPPPGVDFTGHWLLNEAESDDPQHLMQAANAKTLSAGAGGGGTGRSRGGGGTGAGAGMGGSAMPAPTMPGIGAVGDGLRWPGKRLDIRQVAGVVAFTSDNTDRVCQPGSGGRKHHHGRDPNDRDALPAGRDAPPPTCGWDDKTLIVRGGDPDEERPPFEEEYSLSEDGQRLIEVVGFKGGRSNGFTMSRVWDKIQP